MDLRRKTPDRSLPAEAITKAGQKTERLRCGSAIILAVVLTTLLAIIGVLFLFSSRVDSVATSAVGDNHDLKLAVDTVVAQISEILTHNVPGVDPNAYYNYPDANNPWLACLEPYYNSGTNDYRWQQVSNIYGSSVFQNVQAQILPDYNNMFVPYTEADADGDGVSDSFWVEVNDVNSSKGKPIYAAIRIIDNGGMLNVNTGYIFDPCTSVGSTQLDINLMTLAALDNTHTAAGEKESRLLSYRCGTADANFYGQNVVWQYGLPANGAYTPFDISDELKLRNRYIINYNQDTTRIESLWTNTFDGPPYKPRYTPYNSINDPCAWFWIVSNNYPSSCPNPYVYDNRHIATTYNMDRIIDPNDSKMFNINSASFSNIITLRDTIHAALEPNENYDANQIAVNLIDYIDTDSNVTYFVDPCTSKSYFGFETPCIYISQIAENFYQPDPLRDPTTIYRSYAVELFKPYTGDSLPDANWQLVISSIPNPIQISWSVNSSFFVIADINANAPLDINVSAFEVNDTRVVFGAGDRISLQRIVNGFPLTVDSLVVPLADPTTGWLYDTSPHSIQRDITLNKCIRKLWSGVLSPPELGSFSPRYVCTTDNYVIQAHPANKSFTNIGEIGQLLSCDPISIDQNSTEASVRLNIADSNFQNLFKYLTVMDPNIYTNETRIKGRININTAPWYVLAQLPWVSYNTTNYDLARSIANYRDTYGPFKNIGELMNVGIINNDSNSLNRMDYYVNNAIPTTLATPTDCNGDVFEERDVIFDRISNLITVRSDVFTAYILVRIGPNGPQKRVVAIFDRSGVTPAGGKVKVVAIQQVPDPR